MPCRCRHCHFWWGKVPASPQACSVAQSCLTLCNQIDCKQASVSITNSRSLFKVMSSSRWCHPTISSSVVPLSSCLQSFPASGPFPVSWLFASCSQSIGASVSASVLPMNIQGRFPLGLTGLISLLSKGFSRVFNSTTIWSYQFFGGGPSLLSNSHICTWLLEKP